MRAKVSVGGVVDSIHTFILPELCEKHCFRHTSSFDSFRSANNKILNESLAQKATPAKLALVRFDADCEHKISVAWPTTPFFEHEDIFAFYAAIGWDFKRKKYLIEPDKASV